VALPAPSDLTTLANRLAVRSSVARAVDALDAFALRVLEVVTLLGQAATEAAIADLVGADAADVASTVRRLQARGLVWQSGVRLSPVGPLPEILGAHLAGLGQPLAELWSSVPLPSVRATLATLGIDQVRQPDAGVAIAAALATPDRLRELLGTRSLDEKALLTNIAAAGPTATLPPGHTPADADSAAAGLARVGLLVPVDPTTVEVPREVGLLVRPAPAAGGVSPAPPAVELDPPHQRAVDGTGVTQVLEVTRQVAALARSWSDDPPPALRAGGLGVRELRRTARELELSDGQAALLAEIAAAAGLVAPSATIPPHYVPTTDIDTWTTLPHPQRWRRLAETWRDMRRQPSLAGARDDRGRLISVLSVDVERANALTTRRAVLDVLARLEPGARPQASQDILALLAWRAPRRISSMRPGAVAALVEAEALGITGGGALTTFGRHLIAGDGAAAELALAEAMPAAVDEFLLQPDLTAVVPGPPSPALAEALAMVADLESSGGAQVWRLTPDSIRRAMDSGASADELTALLRSRSRTPVPQALSYLIEDTARRYGRLRAGGTRAYLRCRDEALLDQVCADPGLGSAQLHRVAGTVAVSAVELDVLLGLLRRAGYAPAAEDRSGAALTVRAEPPRARPPRRSDRTLASTGLSPEALAETVRRIRLGDELARTASPVSVSSSVPGVTSARTLGLLREAIRRDHRVWVAYIEQSGRTATRIIAPLSLGGGFLRGHDTETREFRSIPLHRLTSVNVLDD
jgi:hypothetical protein